MNRHIPWNLVLVLLVATAFRLILLDIKPPHFDEGVNGWFVDQITKNGFFQYDPTNYHGPLHFYALFLSQTLLGRNLWALRLPTVIVSLLCVFLTWKVGNFFNRRTANLAAWAMAVSPGFVFYGRYAIHETWLVLFLLLFVWGIFEFSLHRSRAAISAICIAMTGMILTKETYVIHLICFFLAGLLTYVFSLFYHGTTSTHGFLKSIRLSKPDLWYLVACLLLCVLAIVFFYSGNFLNFPALPDLFKTYTAWFKTGMETSGGHSKTDQDFLGLAALNTYWPWLMWHYEWPAFLGLVGSIRYLFRTRWELRWLSIYGVGCLYAYTLIPYKTPWCIISIIWPFLLIFGAVLGEWSKKKPYTIIFGMVLLAISVGQSIKLNFFDYAKHTDPYVYVQTDISIRQAIDPLLGMAKQNPEFYHKRGQFLLDSYYPLPWILGDFTNVGYYSDKDPSELDADFIFIPAKRQCEIESKLKQSYYRRAFTLRDGMEDCLAYFRAATYSKWFHYKAPEFSPNNP